jgi:hypothetical protein
VTHKEDYAYFDAVNGVEYTIETSNLGTNADTYLYVYDTDGVTQLAYDDDGGVGLASRIVWICPGSGRYYVRERPYSDSRDGAKSGSGAGERTGADATYDLQVTASQVPRPDLLVKCSLETSYIGDDVYNDDGTNQTKSQNVAPGVKARYNFLLYNDGVAAESFTLTGTAAGTGWAAKYYMSGAGEQTAAFTGGGYAVNNLGAGSYVAGWFDVYQLPGGGGGLQQDVLVTATSVSTPSSVDAVKGVTSWGPTPDLLVKCSTETSYCGDGVYNADGTNQSEAQNTAPGSKARYNFLL